jgi:hypothetical protein
MEAVFSIILLDDEQILHATGGAIQATLDTFKDDLYKLLKRLERYQEPLEYNHGAEFDLDDYSDADYKRFMRFTKSEIRRIWPLLHLEEIQWRERQNPKPEAAFCILLWKLSSKSRFIDLLVRFYYSDTSLCNIYNDMLTHLERHYSGLLFWDHHRINLTQIHRYRDYVKAVLGSP